MSPRRIQRKRTKGWRMPEGAIYVGRPTKWANPVSVRRVMDNWAIVDDGVELEYFRTRRDAIEAAVDEFARCIHPAAPVDPWFQYPLIADMERELAGRDLACWCALDQPCHADVLLQLANGGDRS